MSKPDENNPINKLLNLIQKDFKSAFKTSDTEIGLASEELPPTGILVDNPLFEFLLDLRFLAYGRCILAHGKKSSGKTSFLFFLISLFQQNGGYANLAEPENALDKFFA